MDPYACATKKQNQYFDVYDTVHVYYFITAEGGTVSGTVLSTNYRYSPIPAGGLEIPLKLRFACKDDEFLRKMKWFVTNLYDYDFEGRRPDEEDSGDEGRRPDEEDSGDEGRRPDEGDSGNEGRRPDEGDSGDEGRRPDEGDSGDEGRRPDEEDSGDEGRRPDEGDSGDEGRRPDEGDSGDEGRRAGRRG